ncbi:hypothetical protein Igag_0554 [Ignisphaera aggregans DSM 17230]|uniref:Uncharacterized protein n=1 Tax=Ignisphaera aggregans (strain DSM 17230 / JCM 13409 / AQ1.S1) TaxID=583356 RepID=E0SS40_IGNAA|nr:hypothetical protein Igag_0554 [Ignisphaera aggregans DSM 17230]
MDVEDVVKDIVLRQNGMMLAVLPPDAVECAGAED